MKSLFSVVNLFWWCFYSAAVPKTRGQYQAQIWPNLRQNPTQKARADFQNNLLQLQPTLKVSKSSFSQDAYLVVTMLKWRRRKSTNTFHFSFFLAKAFASLSSLFCSAGDKLDLSAVVSMILIGFESSTDKLIPSTIVH